MAGIDFQDAYGNPIHASDTHLRNRIRELERYLEYFNQLPEDAPLYDESLMLQRVWQRLLDQPGRLEQISIVSCLPNMVERAYPELQMLRDRGIRVVFKPTNAFMSFLQRKQITTTSIDWIRESLKVGTR